MLLPWLTVHCLEIWVSQPPDYAMPSHVCQTLYNCKAIPHYYLVIHNLPAAFWGPSNLYFLSNFNTRVAAKLGLHQSEAEF